MDNDRGTVDRLIQDLGAIRAFLDEAESVPEASGAPQIADVRGAMDVATDAISRVFTDSQDAVVEAAWTAIARAQDAIALAREVMTDARAQRQDAEEMRERNRAQLGRARQHSQVVSEQSERVRRRAQGKSGGPPAPCREDEG